jgi:hypothetical protein
MKSLGCNIISLAVRQAFGDVKKRELTTRFDMWQLLYTLEQTSAPVLQPLHWLPGRALQAWSFGLFEFNINW